MEVDSETEVRTWPLTVSVLVTRIMVGLGVVTGIADVGSCEEVVGVGVSITDSDEDEGGWVVVEDGGADVVVSDEVVLGRSVVVGEGEEVVVTTGEIVVG